MIALGHKLATQDVCGLLCHSDGVLVREDNAADNFQFVAGRAGDVLTTGERETHVASEKFDFGEFGRKNVSDWHRFDNRPAVDSPAHDNTPCQPIQSADLGKDYLEFSQGDNRVTRRAPSHAGVSNFDFALQFKRLRNCESIYGCAVHSEAGAA